MIYTKKQIEVLSKALLGDKASHNKLVSENPKLIKLEGALRGDARAIQWLLKNDKVLAAFDDAIGGNKSAVRFLLQNNEPGLAAVANYVHGDDQALNWLKQQDFSHFVLLAQSIQKFLEKEAGKDISFFYTP